MLRDYEVVSPSLEGVLKHELLTYEGLNRPVELLRILDGPAAKGSKLTKVAEDIEFENKKKESNPEQDLYLLERYFYDLYGIFMKKISHFVVEPEISSDGKLVLQAMLQEMIKVKGLITQKPMA